MCTLMKFVLAESRNPLDPDNRSSSKPPALFEVRPLECFVLSALYGCAHAYEVDIANSCFPFLKSIFVFMIESCHILAGMRRR